MWSWLSRSHLLTWCGHMFARKSTFWLRLMSTCEIVRGHYYDCEIVIIIQFLFMLLVRLDLRETSVSNRNVKSSDGPYLILIKFWSDEVSIMTVTIILHVYVFKKPWPIGCRDASITCVGIHEVWCLLHLWHKCTKKRQEEEMEEVNFAYFSDVVSETRATKTPNNHYIK